MVNVCVIALVLLSAATLFAIPIDKLIKNAKRKYAVGHPRGGSHGPNRSDGGHLIQGDIIVSKKEWEKIKSGKRNALRDTQKRWTNEKVRYQITNGVFTTPEINVIKGSIAEWERVSCLKFEDVGSAGGNKLVFMAGAGCSSWVGMNGDGAQQLSLGSGCLYNEVVIHEIGHAIGMEHEQTRPDRDNFVTVHTANIVSDMRFNFDKSNNQHQNNYGVPYDYLSAMHYGRTAFSSNGKDTITTKDASFQNKIGEAKHLSYYDVKLANIMYDCAAKASCTPKVCPNGGFQDKHCNCRCKGSPTVACTGGPATTKPPTKAPTVAPTAGPTVAPTAGPTVAPTAGPTIAPTAGPTVAPTVAPTAAPIATAGTPATAATPAPAATPATATSQVITAATTHEATEATAATTQAQTTGSAATTNAATASTSATASTIQPDSTGTTVSLPATSSTTTESYSSTLTTPWA